VSYYIAHNTKDTQKVLKTVKNESCHWEFKFHI